MDQRSPAVAVIVLNWNRCADTLACLASLGRLDYPLREVIVVDNGSRDESAAAIGAAYSRVTLIETGDNLGFVGGNNVGLERARAAGVEYSLLLNNDTEVAPDSLRLLVEAAAADPAVGIAGPTIYYATDRGRIWSAGGAIAWQRGATHMIGLGELDRGQFGQSPRPVDFVSGCALLIKMAAVDRVGLMDPRFFAYYEDTEWCVRVARAGFTILHVPQARIWHKISPAERADSPAVHYYMTRNRLLFLQSVRATWRAWAHTLFAEYLRTLASWSLRPKWRARRRQRTLMAWAIVDYFTGRLGRAARELDVVFKVVPEAGVEHRERGHDA
jgi:GT2 family glycosyltransferase